MEYKSSGDMVEEHWSLDTREEVSSTSDSSLRYLEAASVSSEYEVWIRDPESVTERRNKFLRSMGLDVGETNATSSVEVFDDVSIDYDRVMNDGGAVLRSSSPNDRFFSSRSYISNWSDEGTDISEKGYVDETFHCRIKNFDDGSEYAMDGLDQDADLCRIRQLHSNRSYTVDKFQKNLRFSTFVEQFMRREVPIKNLADGMGNIGAKGWLRKLRAVACILDKQRGEDTFRSGDSDSSSEARSCIVRVHTSKKNFKELSAVHEGQEINAHAGPILTMKFSPDGKYLASAGEDKIVRVWQVIECTKKNENHIQDDMNCLYVMVDYKSKLTPVFVHKESITKIKGIRKKPDSTCVVTPATVFKLSEKPLHEFHGHSGDVLDLSWSKNKYLLSSSVDKTVHLWKVGCDRCIKIFTHNNYVTCVQFNPVDDNYFISGSIDGKVRIWAIAGCEVVDWIDIREIVTAICYRPDGQGGIVGSMTGNCRFYDTSENRLQLHAEVSLQGKKKYPYNRITGFEFSPSDPAKVMVTSADSQVRILYGHDVVCRYRGLRNAGSKMSASFTSDGKHIVSASDNNVYLLNYNNLDAPKTGHTKSVWSCERFLSRHLSVAVPWSGFKSETSESFASGTIETNHEVFKFMAAHSETESHYQSDSSHNGSSDRSCLRNGFWDVLPRASATWPEEKLPTPMLGSLSPAKCRSHLKSLKTYYQNTINSSHAWGLVIVTAGWDGRIRSFLNYGLPIRF